MTTTEIPNITLSVRVAAKDNGYRAGLYSLGELFVGQANTRYGAACAALSKLVSKTHGRNPAGGVDNIVPAVALIDAETLASASECQDHSSLRVTQRLDRAGITLQAGEIVSGPPLYEIMQANA